MKLNILFQFILIMSCLYRDYQRVEDYEDYIISNYGEVYSLKYGKVREMKLNFNDHGYKMVNLRNKNTVKKFTVHVLVGNAFVGKRTNGLEFDHIDRNRTNNRSDNIRLATRSEQMINQNLRPNNKLRERNIWIANQNNGRSYYHIRINRNKKKVLEKYLNVKKYTLEDAIKFRDDFLLTFEAKN